MRRHSLREQLLHGVRRVRQPRAAAAACAAAAGVAAAQVADAAAAGVARPWIAVLAAKAGTDALPKAGAGTLRSQDVVELRRLLERHAHFRLVARPVVAHLLSVRPSRFCHVCTKPKGICAASPRTGASQLHPAASAIGKLICTHLDSELISSNDVTTRVSTASCLFLRISASVTIEEMATPSADSCTSPCSCRNLCLRVDTKPSASRQRAYNVPMRCAELHDGPIMHTDTQPLGGSHSDSIHRHTLARLMYETGFRLELMSSLQSEAMHSESLVG